MNYANVAYNLLPSNMESATLTIESRPIATDVTVSHLVYKVCS